MNRLKNGAILICLISFLCIIAIKPVPCVINSLTGFYCPNCGITRAFIFILNFDIINAFFTNILSIPLFILLWIFIFFLLKDFIQNQYKFIPNLLIFFSNHWIFIIAILIISTIYNNI